MDGTTVTDAAARYKALGLKPIRLRPRSKNPINPGWQTSDGDDPSTFKDDENVGILTGEKSGIYDVDCDVPEAAPAAAKVIPTGWVFGRPGKLDSHRIVSLKPGEEPIGRVTFQDADGTMLLEIRGNGHQTMLPPSVHPSGEQLGWTETGKPAAFGRDHLIRQAGIAATIAMLARGWATWDDQRNALAMAFAGGLAKSETYKSPDVGESIIRAVCRIAGDHEPENRVSAFRNTYLKVEAETPVTGWPKLGSIIGRNRVRLILDWLGIDGAIGYGLNDADNALRLIDKFGADLRYCDALGGWRFWDGHRWDADDTGAVHEFAKETARAIPDEARKLPTTEEGDDKRKKINSWAAQSLNAGRLAAMVNLAQTDSRIAARHADFDRDAWAFNVLNGAINLRTGGIAPHERRDLLTKLAPVTFDQKATCPTWDTFLLRSMDGNADMVAYLQRIVGYTMTGDTQEQCWFLLHGDGENGKSTFIETLAALFGDYYLKVPTGTFMHKKGESGLPPALALLPGARFVTCNETTLGGRFDEAALKDVTGGDTIAAKALYHMPFQFKPVLKLFIYGNHRPLIRGNDKGTWRRVKLIPFTATLAPHERILGLSDILRTELAGILNWCIRGCLAWQLQGLNAPERVTKATADYRSDMDLIGRFIDECCTTGDGVTEWKRLYAAYAEWATANGEEPHSGRVFGSELERRGFPTWKSNGVVYRRGIALRETEQADWLRRMQAEAAAQEMHGND